MPMLHFLPPPQTPIFLGGVKKCNNVSYIFYTPGGVRGAKRVVIVQLFDIATSKSAPKLMRFVHFDFEMCFAPQRRALFRHLNFQKWSDPGVFCTFWLGNVLPATTACTFSSLIWPDGSAPAALASLLFDPPEPHTHKSLEKTQCFATFLPFHLHLLSFDSFSSLIFSLLLFSSLWPFPSLLFICPYCRKFDF